MYRRCKLEDIDLPLIKGSLSKVPLDEVSFLKMLGNTDDFRNCKVLRWTSTMTEPRVRLL